MTNAEVLVFTDIMDTELIEKSIVARLAQGLYKESTPVVTGAAIEILGTEKIVIGNYSGTISHQTLAGTKQTVAIDKVPYFSVKIDDVEDYATAPKNLKTKVAKDAGMELALATDKEFVKLTSKAKVTVSGTKADIAGVIEGVATELDIANVAEGNRAIVLDPASARMLATQLGAALQVDRAASEVYGGTVHEYQGVMIFKSNQVVKTTTVFGCLGFDVTALNMPKNFADTREITDASFFGVLIQGVLSYGIDIVETETGKSNRLVNAEIDHA